MTATDFDLSDIRGNDTALLDAARAVATRTNLLLMGPPGIGKTMLARRITALMGPLDDHAQRWVAAEHAHLGLGGEISERPFRAPHHTVSAAGLVGAPVYSQTSPEVARRRPGYLPPLPRSIPRAGELHLARFGVLFLDEAIEFHRSALEDLRARWLQMSAPTRPLIVASVQPCPCGWRADQGHPSPRACACTDGMIGRYLDRLARYSTLLGLEIGTWMHPVTLDTLRGPRGPLTTAALRERIVGGAL